MFHHFFKTAFRIFQQEKIYSVLNIIGLAIGISVAIIILLYLQQDLTYDRYHSKAENIYRVNTIYISSGKETKFAMSPASFGPTALEEFPEVIGYVRVASSGQRKISYDDKMFYENVFVTDSTIFDIFTHEFLYGDPSTCLQFPNSIILTESLSAKFFGKKNPVGTTIILDQSLPFQVTAVIKDLPENVHVQYDALIPVKFYDPRGELKNSSFFDINSYTYLLLPDNYDVQDFYEKFPAFYDKYAAKMGQALNMEYKAILQPMLDIHFSREWSHDLPNGNKTYTIAFLIIGILVFSLSCINYINMTTARADSRRKEIAVKKILGSKRLELIVQFLGESIMLTIIAMILALAIVQFVLGFTSFSQLINKDLVINLKENVLLSISLPIIILIAGFLSGIYPAIYLSMGASVNSLPGKIRSGKSLFSFRKALVVFQMIISVSVIICTLMIDYQIRYVRNKDLGLNKENLLIIPLNDSLVYNHFTAFKTQLLQNQYVSAVSSAYNVPAWGAGNLVYRVETENGMEENIFNTLFTSYDFIQTMGITLLKGRDFDVGIPSDFRSSFIINESMAKKMGWDEPLGKHLQQRFDINGIPYYDGYVIGVLRDFNYQSLHNAIEPMVLRLQDHDGGVALIKLTGAEIAKTMKYIEDTWHQFSNEFPSDITFLDKNFDELYKKDQQQNMLIKILSLISIIISCLGLLSIASYITKIRNKEIVIRKVYGAPIRKITFMLYQEIFTLIIISLIFAIPLAYWFTEKMLNNFAYKAGFSAGLILLTIIGVILLTIMIISYHSIRASYSNPARFLKTE